MEKLVVSLMHSRKNFEFVRNSNKYSLIFKTYLEHVLPDISTLELSPDQKGFHDGEVLKAFDSRNAVLTAGPTMFYGINTCSSRIYEFSETLEIHRFNQPMSK